MRHRVNKNASTYSPRSLRRLGKLPRVWGPVPAQSVRAGWCGWVHCSLSPHRLPLQLYSHFVRHVAWQLWKPPAKNWSERHGGDVLEPRREWKWRTELGQVLRLGSSVGYERQRDGVTFSLHTCLPSCFYLFPFPPHFPWGFNYSPSTTHFGVRGIRKIVRSGICYLTFSTRMIFFLRHIRTFTIKKVNHSSSVDAAGVQAWRLRLIWHLTLLSVTSTPKINFAEGLTQQ